MAIKTVVESLEDVPEALHEHYTETDDGFVLNVDGVDDHPDVKNLKSAYQKVKDSEKEAQKTIKELQGKESELPEDFDPELWKKVKSGETEKHLVEVRKQLEGQLEGERTKAQELEQKLHGLTVERTLDDALTAANITNPTYRKAARVMLKDSVKLDGDKVIVDSDMGPLDPQDFVKKWASTDEGKAFVSQPKGGGSKTGDSTASTGPKSWDEATDTKSRVEFLRQKMESQQR